MISIREQKIQLALSRALLDYDSFNDAVNRAELRGVYYYGRIPIEVKLDRINMERDNIQYMEYYQLKLLSEVTTAMASILNLGGTMADLDRWTADTIDNAVEYNSRSFLCKLKDFALKILFPL